MRPNCPLMATDIIIEYNDGKKEGIVLIERKYPPYGRALPGGHWEEGLTLGQNAAKEAIEETGLEVRIENPDMPFRVFSKPSRDPRYHIGTAVYIARGFGTLKAGDDAKEAHLYSIDEVVGMLGKDMLVFDHEDIIKAYLVHRGYL